jgi:hypothetical protein
VLPPYIPLQDAFTDIWWKCAPAGDRFWDCNKGRSNCNDSVRTEMTIQHTLRPHSQGRQVYISSEVVQGFINI